MALPALPYPPGADVDLYGGSGDPLPALSRLLHPARLTMSNWLDIGNGHRLQQTMRADGRPHGWIDEHMNPQTGKPCCGAVTREGMARGDEATWHVISEEPLTLEPSLLCRTCGEHGFVREGKWVPA